MDLFPKWYRAKKQFKYRPKSGYPTSAFRIPYQYLVAMWCRLYWEPDASQFSLSYIPLIYYCAYEGVPFNWDEIMSENLMVAISMVKRSHPRTFPRFHMYSYLLDIMCTTHKYPTMGWSWQPSDPTFQVYYKMLWEHKHHT